MLKVFLAKSLWKLADYDYRTYNAAASQAIAITDMANTAGDTALNKVGTIVAD